MSIPIHHYVNDDPERPYNQPFHVEKQIYGTMRPFVAASRQISVDGWLRDMPLETVIQTWFMVNQKELNPCPPTPPKSPAS